VILHSTGPRLWFAELSQPEPEEAMDAHWSQQHNTNLTLSLLYPQGNKRLLHHNLKQTLYLGFTDPFASVCNTEMKQTLDE